MNKTQKALEMAIEYLTNIQLDYKGHEVRKACKEALEQQAQEPVAWLYKRENSSGGWYVVTNYEKEHDNGTRNIQCYDIPLYAHPAPSWQGLSDDEILIICAKMAAKLPNKKIDLIFARAIEQALKEKNNV